MKRITNINAFTTDNDNNHVMINCMIDDVEYSVNYSSNFTLYNFISNELMRLNDNITTIKANLTDKDGASDA